MIGKKKSRLSGFVDGFRASNIASLESSIKYHLNEIETRILLIQSESNIQELSLYSSKALKILKDSYSDYIDRLIQLGEALKAIVIIGKISNLGDSGFSNHIKMIVYHYIELAEKLEDKRINSLAIEIGELL